MANVIAAIEALADVIIAKKEFLTELDAAIGDADHGINMARGFEAVRAKLAAANPEDIGGVLKLVGMTLISTVGGLPVRCMGLRLCGQRWLPRERQFLMRRQ